MPTITRQTFLFLVLLLVSATSIADSAIDEANSLMDSGNAAAAFALLKPMEADRAGEFAFDYTLGIAAIESGQPLDAVFALERAVDANPESGQARAELARAYLLLGDTDEAKGEFDKVKDMDLPSEVQRTIDSYISGIDSYHDASRTRWRPYITIGLGYDSNVNAATDESRIAVPALGGLVFDLDNDARESDSMMWDVGGGVRITSPLDYDRGLSLFTNIDVIHQLALHEADFSALLANGQVGVNWRRDQQNQFRLSLDGNTVKVEGSTALRSDREVIGTTGQWQYTMDQANQFTAFAQAQMVRYPDQRVRDVNRYTGGIGWGHAFIGAKYDPVISVTAFGGTEDEKSESSGSHFSNNFFGVRAAGQIRPHAKGTIYAAMDYQHADYNGTDPTFLVKRDDDYFSVRTGYRYQFDDNWSVTPTVTYNNNDSNLPTSDYDRVEVMVTLRNDF